MKVSTPDIVSTPSTFCALDLVIHTTAACPSSLTCTTLSILAGFASVRTVLVPTIRTILAVWI